MRTVFVLAALLVAMVLLSFQSFTPAGVTGVVAPLPSACMGAAMAPERIVHVAFEWLNPEIQQFPQLQGVAYSVPEDSYLYVTDYVISGRHANAARLLEDDNGIQTLKIPLQDLSSGQTSINGFNAAFRTPILFGPGCDLVVEFTYNGSTADNFYCLISGFLVPSDP